MHDLQIIAGKNRRPLSPDRLRAAMLLIDLVIGGLTSVIASSCQLLRLGTARSRNAA